MTWNRRRWAATTAAGGLAVLGVVAAGPALPFGDAPEAVEAPVAAMVAPLAEAGPDAARPAVMDSAASGPALEDATVEAAAEAAEVVVLETSRGSASYYANSLAGRRTASGVPYRPRDLVAAHRTLPFGTRLRVTNEANGRTVEVEVVDRGPFAKGRVLDLSRRAAEELGFIRQGHTRVRIEVLDYGDG